MNNVSTIEAERPLGTFLSRSPERHDLGDLHLVSVDNHICLGGEDFWYERAPDHLKTRVPRIWFDEAKGLWVTGFDGVSINPFDAGDLVRTMESHDGAWSVEARMADMDAEGVAIELAFPQILIYLIRMPDIEARTFIFEEYNAYLGRLQRKAPGRFFGVGIVNYWDTERTRQSIFDMKRDGLKTFMLPTRPGVDAKGEPISWMSEAMEPMWQAIEGSGLPLCFHIGEAHFHQGKAATALNLLKNICGPDFRQTWTELVFGGILDRHPGLKVGFVEAGLNWVPGLIQDAEMLVSSYDGLLDYVPLRSPADYWRDNCFATFMDDPAGLRLIDRIGIENALWSVDYPHHESTFGKTGTVVRSIYEQLGAKDAGKVLGQNAMEIFKFDQDTTA